MTNWAGHLPGALNLQIIRGGRLIVPLEFTDDDGSPLDLTGYIVRATYRRGAVSQGFDIDEGSLDATGKFDLVMDVAQTRALPIGIGLWELEFEVGNDVIPMLRGSVQVLAELAV